VLRAHHRHAAEERLRDPQARLRRLQQQVSAAAAVQQHHRHAQPCLAAGGSTRSLAGAGGRAKGASTQPRRAAPGGSRGRGRVG
jgi:hypothetical protein